MGAGIYTYTVAATAPCDTDATATVIVTEQQRPDAGTDGNLTICEGDVPTEAQLFAQLGGTPDLGGTWSPALVGAGIYTYTVAATAPCANDATAQVTVTEGDLVASVEPVYSCDANQPTNSILVTLFDPSMNDDVMYALDSMNPNDFVLSPNFNNISPGDHSLFIIHNNGCLSEYPFSIDGIEPLELALSNDFVNGITANVTGGSAPYTYYFDNGNGTSSNTYTINRNGTFMVTVMDAIGCEITESITMNFVDISIPDFFTPDNNDGQNDFWGPRNTEAFPNIQTYIFDRYGRKIQILGQSDVWNGYYESKPLPSGDYWYIVKLNDGSGREFVGHFTLYR